MSNADVQIVVSLRDASSRQLLQSLGMIDAETGKINASAGKAGSALEQMNRKAMGGGAALKGMSHELDAMTGKARVLGDRLNGGFKSALGTAKQIAATLSQGVAGAAHGAAVVAGAATAGAMVMRPQVDFDRQVSQNANVMFGTRDASGQLYSRADADAQKTRLTQQVDAAVAGGIGSRDDALLAQNTLLASGKFTGDEGLRRLDALMPMLMKASAGSGTDPVAMANMAVAFANKGYDDAQIKAAVAKGMVSDSMGSFSVKSMANWMPKWLAGAGDALKGEHAADALFVHAQTVRKNSGTDDEAGVNMENVIGFASSDKGDKTLKKIYGVDRKAEVEKYMYSGDDFLTANARMLNKVVENDAHFQALKKKAVAAQTDADKSRVYEEMAGYTAQGVVGDIYTDVQARKAMMGIMADVDSEDVAKRMAASRSETGQTINDVSAQRVEGDAKSAYDKTANAKDRGLTSMVQQLGGAIGDAADWFSGFVDKHPVAGGSAILGSTLLGGGVLMSAAAKMSGVLGGSSAGAAGGVGNALGWIAQSKGLLKGAGVVGMAGAAAWNAGGSVMDLAGDKASARERTEAKANLTGTGVGAVIGGAIGSVVPVLGTALGAAAGAWLGGVAGSWIGGKMADSNQAVEADRTSAMLERIGGQIAQVNAASQAAPAGQELVQANAQLQQVNAQVAALTQASNNAPLEAQLQQVNGGLAQLNAKNYSMTATIPVYIDGGMVSQTVNKINTTQSYRGAR